VIADARLPDHPLIYVNAAFETITGYSRSDVLGRNCRFLQGGATDRETVAEIRAALDAGDECTRVVLNFRKDGSPFWNELRISPVHDNAGVLTHFIGIQHVTERLTAKHLPPLSGRGGLQRMAFIVWIIVGAIAGFLASKVLTGRGMGLVWDIVVGILGAFLGGWLAGLAGIAITNIVIEIIVAFVGALILLFIFRALTHRGVIHA
jgi:PAS domain S-box-containing protein